MRWRRHLAALERSLILGLVFVLALGPAEINYATNVQTARLHRGEPSLLYGLLAAVGDFLCPTVYALDNEHDHTTSATSSSTTQSWAAPKEVLFLIEGDPSVRAASTGETCEVGRFTSRDPMGCWFDGMQRGNGYGAFGCNGINSIDPSGLGWGWDFVTAFAGGVAGSVHAIGNALGSAVGLTTYDPALQAQSNPLIMANEQGGASAAATNFAMGVATGAAAVAGAVILAPVVLSPLLEAATSVAPGAVDAVAAALATPTGQYAVTAVAVGLTVSSGKDAVDAAMQGDWQGAGMNTTFAIAGGKTAWDLGNSMNVWPSSAPAGGASNSTGVAPGRTPSILENLTPATCPLATATERAAARAAVTAAPGESQMIDPRVLLSDKTVLSPIKLDLQASLIDPNLGVSSRLDPVVVNQDGWIYEGNHGSAAAIQAGLDEIPVRVVNWPTPAELRPVKNLPVARR